MTPLISIITPAYNAEKYLAETIESVLQQTYSNWELLITNDGSTDKTAEIIQQYESKDKRIRSFYQENGKQGKARNLAIKHAQGKYLAFIDADDLWAENKLEKQLAVLEQNPEIDIVFTNGISFRGDINHVVQTTNARGGKYDYKEMLEKVLMGKAFPNLSVMLRKDKLTDLGGFCEIPKVQNAEDQQMWMRMIEAGSQVYCVTENLFYYRLHEEQVTAQDSMAFVESFWGLYYAEFKQTNNRKYMLKRLNRRLSHYIEDLSVQERNKLVSLYLYPLKRLDLYVFNKLLLSLGVDFFKKYYYRLKIHND